MEYAYLVRPAFDRAFLDHATDDERVVVEQHGEWLDARFAEGRVRFAGRCDDGPFGIVVVAADDEQDARLLMAQDPSVRAGIQRGELHPFLIFLAREHGPEER